MEKLFKLKEHNTTVKTEVMAGITTFLTIVSILMHEFWQPRFIYRRFSPLHFSYFLIVHINTHNCMPLTCKAYPRN